MAPPRTKKDVVLDICTKATLLGNKISVHMLEYLSTVRNHPDGFDSLAHEFLEICRILWSIEAGLHEFGRTNRQFPADMLNEIEKKFKTTYSDFQSLDNMLFKFLDQERKGTMGKIQKGWRKMFPDNEIHRMRESLAKTREALRMSALVFQWSLGDAKIDDSVGMGYTGLAAALDRMDRQRTGTSTPSVHSNPRPVDDPQPSLSGTTLPSPTRELEEPQLPPLPTTIYPPSLPSLPPVSLLERDSGKDFLVDDKLSQDVQRRLSISSRTVSSVSGPTRDRDQLGVSRERMTSPGSSLERMMNAHTSIMTSTTGHTRETDPLDAELDNFDISSIKVTHIKADPFTMPRWSPRQMSGANAANLKTTLITAVESSNHNLVEQLLDRGVSPDTAAPDTTVLNTAAMHHDIETMRLLLLFGADPNLPDSDGILPLATAISNNFVEGATLLLRYGAHAEAQLSMAIADNKLAFIQLLLTYAGDVNNLMTDGNTILIGCIGKKTKKKLVDLLLAFGADPNAKNREGTSPLFAAISNGRADILTSLLDAGADPNLPGPKHMLWPSTYRPDCLEILLARGASFKKAPGIMELATSLNNIESVRILLSHGVDPNAKKDGVYTPLCSSIRDNRPDIFELLLTNGADPNTPASEYPAWKCVTHFRQQFLPALVQAGADLHNPKGILEMAVQKNNMEALRWLMEQGVNPNDRAKEGGHTPLTTAIREGKMDVVEFLLRSGADANVRGENWPVCMAVKQPAMLRKILPYADVKAHKGVLEMAVMANQLDSIKLLLAAGVSVEDKNGGVFSPLTTALREDRFEIVHFLLDEAGADPNAPGEHLPIVKAVRRFKDNDYSMLEALLAKGADPNKIYRGWNAIMQAIENADAGVLRLLIEKGGGVDLEARDEAGRTVAQLAESTGWDEASEILYSTRR